MGKSKKSKDEMNHEIVGHEEKPKKKKKKDRVDEEDAPVGGEGMVEVKVEGGGGSRKTGGGGGTELRIRDITRHTGTSKVGPLLPHFSHAPCRPAELVAAQPDITISTEPPEPAPGGERAGDWPRPSLSLGVGGILYRGGGGSRGDYSTYLAIRERGSGWTHLVEACPVVLSPQVAAPPTRNPLLLAAVEEEQAKDWETKMKESKNLIKNFGRKTGAKYYEDRDRMKVEVNTTAVAAAAGGVEASMVTSPKESAATVPDILPKRQDGAARVQLVYRLEDLLTSSELSALGEAGERFLATECNSQEQLKVLVERRLVSALGSTLLAGCLASSASLGHRPAVILYMEGIIRFTKLRPGERAKGPRALQKFLPLPVGAKIFASFGGPGGVVSPELRDRAICHILVLGLLASNFRLETIHLTDSVFVKNDHLKKLVAMTGAHMEADDMKLKQFITLKLPLAKFDVNYVGGGRKRGRGR